MDVPFQPTRGRPFTIEVGFFDTVSEIKEKIEKDQGILVPAQTLVFNGNVLQDDLNIHDSEILDRSYIQLLLSGKTATNNNGHEICYVQSSPTPSKKICLIVKLPNRAQSNLKLEMEAQDTIKKLKERIHEMEGLPIRSLLLNQNGKELRDPNESLHDYALSNCSEVEVSLRASSMSSSGSSGCTNGSKILRITILSKCGTKKVSLEVNRDEKVAELKKELQNYAQLDLAPEGYLFIYKQNVMDDDQSIRWHHDGQGDTIEIFNGCITDGSKLIPIFADGNK